jgi:hypothetical protein
MKSGTFAFQLVSDIIDGDGDVCVPRGLRLSRLDPEAIAAKAFNKVRRERLDAAIFSSSLLQLHEFQCEHHGKTGHDF